MSGPLEQVRDDRVAHHGDMPAAGGLPLEDVLVQELRRGLRQEARDRPRVQGPQARGAGFRGLARREPEELRGACGHAPSGDRCEGREGRVHPEMLRRRDLEHQPEGLPPGDRPGVAAHVVLRHDVRVLRQVLRHAGRGDAHPARCLQAGDRGPQPQGRIRDGQVRPSGGDEGASIVTLVCMTKRLADFFICCDNHKSRNY